MKVSKVLVSLSLFVGSIGFANPAATPTTTNPAMAAPNCEVMGTKVKVADKDACTAKEGTWLMKDPTASGHHAPTAPKAAAKADQAAPKAPTSNQ